MAELINNLLDKALAVSWRLFDLPLYLWVSLVGLGLAGILLLLRRFWKKGQKSHPAFILLAILLVAFPLGFLADYKFHLLQTELESLNQKYLSALQEGPENAKSITLDPSLYLNDNQQTEIIQLFSGCKLWQKPLNAAINLITLKKEEPKAAVFCTIIDLTHPGIQIMLTPEYTETKTFTSVFAQKNHCIVAINGEAGNGMLQGSGYGEWVGNWIYKGKEITMLDTDKRPFLSFDQSNKARYSPSAEVITEKTEDMYNAFWGRSDLLVDGQLVEYKLARPYSRTIMGIDEKGEKLYLMVVDGKRPNYSLGLSLAECAQLLQVMGAHDAMACDQGGSSCLYLDHLKGMVNRPADSDGQERFVYTHFGIKARM